MPEKKRKKEKETESITVKARSLMDKYRTLLMLVGAALAIALISFLFTGGEGPFGFILVGCFFLVAIPYAIFVFMENRKIQGIETHFPDFLRDVAESNRAGMTLPKAITNAGKSDYGALTQEVRKMSSKLSWGVPFERIMEDFADDINSQILKRAVSIIIEAQRSGGEVTTVLETVAEDIRTMKEMQEERKNKLSIYTVTIYAIYGTFLFIVVMLTQSLVPAIPQMQAAAEFLGSGGAPGGTISETEFRTFLFHISLVEAFFSGLIAGQMGEGRISAGFKHSLVLLAFALVAFHFFAHPASADMRIVQTIMMIPPATGTDFEGSELFVSVDRSFTSASIAENVRNVAKQTKNTAFLDVNADQITFLAVNCEECERGDIIVTEDSVIVKKLTELRFKVVYAEDIYRIVFSSPT
jgi:flagellar protein FlaJ